MLPYRIVNVVCSAKLQTDESFQEFLTLADKRFTHRPTMAMYKRNGATIMMFTSKKIRIMGLSSAGDSSPPLLEDRIRAHRKTLLEWINEFTWPIVIEEFTFNNATITHKLPTEINFFKNQHCLECELEIFTGAKFKQTESCHVNVFASGNVVVTGIKNCHQIASILNQLYSLLKK